MGVLKLWVSIRPPWIELSSSCISLCDLEPIWIHRIYTKWRVPSSSVVNLKGDIFWKIPSLSHLSGLNEAASAPQLYSILPIEYGTYVTIPPAFTLVPSGKWHGKLKLEFTPSPLDNYWSSFSAHAPHWLDLQCTYTSWMALARLLFSTWPNTRPANRASCRNSSAVRWKLQKTAMFWDLLRSSASICGWKSMKPTYNKALQRFLQGFPPLPCYMLWDDLEKLKCHLYRGWLVMLLE